MNCNKIAKSLKHEVKFIIGANRINQLPNNLYLPEVAFLGKSNVGKSSLINALCNNQTIAKVSNTPGRTQQINFFAVGDIFTLVDLPGYGFAKVPLYLKNDWQKLILHYLSNNNRLKLVNLLIDARRGIKDHDKQVIELLLSLNIKIEIILTKSDKITNSKKIHEEILNFLETFNYSCNILCVSSKNKTGISNLQNLIFNIVN
jgi:GTP-binding protein